MKGTKRKQTTKKAVRTYKGSVAARKKSASLHRKKTRKINSRQRYGFISDNFSDVEDNPKAFKIIRAIAGKAGQNARAEAKAAGLSLVFSRDNKVIRVMADGSETIVKTKPTYAREFYIKSKPSTVLHAVKKK